MTSIESTLVLRFSPGVGDTIRLSVDGNNAEDSFALDQVELPAPLLEALHGGNLKDDEHDAIKQRVTTWLLGGPPGNGVKQRLLDRLPAGAGPRAISIVYDRDLAAPLLNLPLEMTRLETDSLALYARVRSISHELDTIATATQPTTADWPFKLLLFRAAPTGLDDVPEIAPIVDRLRQTIPGASDRLLIKSITAERGGLPATFKRFVEELSLFTPHAAVFLGHGLLHEGKSYLAFEDDQGESRPIDSQALRTHMQNGVQEGVPLLVLVGCATAAQPVPNRRQSSNVALLGFAQELIRSSLGVSASIGMRSRIKSSEATTFLASFFGALLNERAGDIGAALKSARMALHLEQPTSFAPYAPMLITSRGGSAQLDFVARGFERRSVPRDEIALAHRRTYWAAIAAAAAIGVEIEVLEATRATLDEAVVVGANGHSVLRTHYVATNETHLTLPVELLGHEMNVTSLRFTVGMSPGVAIEAVSRTAGTIAAGLRLFTSDDNDGSVDILLQGATRTTLVEGAIVELLLTLDRSFPGPRELVISAISTEPKVAVLGEINVVILKPETESLSTAPSEHLS